MADGPVYRAVSQIPATPAEESTPQNTCRVCRYWNEEGRVWRREDQEHSAPCQMRQFSLQLESRPSCEHFQARNVAQFTNVFLPGEDQISWPQEQRRTSSQIIEGWFGGWESVLCFPEQRCISCKYAVIRYKQDRDVINMRCQYTLKCFCGCEGYYRSHVSLMDLDKCIDHWEPSEEYLRWKYEQGMGNGEFKIFQPYDFETWKKYHELKK